TTGYEFANAAESAFIGPAGFAAIERAYRALIGAPPTADFAAVARAGKRRLLETWLCPEVRHLVRDLVRLACDEPRVAARELERALTATMIAFPVYRTYLTESRRAGDAVRAGIETPLDEAGGARGGLAAAAPAGHGARHEAERRRPRPTRRAERDAGAVDGTRRGVAPSQSRASTARARPVRAGREHRVPLLPDARRRVAARRRGSGGAAGARR